MRPPPPRRSNDPMTDLQKYALSHPLARAGGYDQQEYRRITFPWSVILTVNK